MRISGRLALVVALAVVALSLPGSAAARSRAPAPPVRTTRVALPFSPLYVAAAPASLWIGSLGLSLARLDASGGARVFTPAQLGLASFEGVSDPVGGGDGSLLFGVSGAAEGGESSLAEVSPEGQVERVISERATGRDTIAYLPVHASSDGTMWVLRRRMPDVNEGAPIDFWTLIRRTPAGELQGFELPTNLELTPRYAGPPVDVSSGRTLATDGAVWLAGYFSSFRIYRFAAGQLRRVLHRGVADLAPADHGAVWAASAGAILRVAPRGPARQLCGSGPRARVASLARDGAGRLWFSRAGSPRPEIGYVDGRLRVHVFRAPAALGAAAPLLEAAAGRIWLLDRRSPRTSRFALRVDRAGGGRIACRGLTRAEPAPRVYRGVSGSTPSELVLEPDGRRVRALQVRYRVRCRPSGTRAGTLRLGPRSGVRVRRVAGQDELHVTRRSGTLTLDVRAEVHPAFVSGVLSLTDRARGHPCRGGTSVSGERAW